MVTHLRCNTVLWVWYELGRILTVNACNERGGTMDLKKEAGMSLVGDATS